MIDIVLPMAANLGFSNDEYLYPKPLIDVGGKLLIEHAIENLRTMSEPHRFVSIVLKSDARKYHLDSVLKLLTKDTDECLVLEAPTQGAACSVLMAIDRINLDRELIIVNYDQVLDVSYDEVIKSFRDNGADSGVVTFESVHPKWSFARLEGREVVEVQEKRPISRNAIAGFYYFRKGVFFIEAAQEMIRKDGLVDDRFFIAPALNELVLMNRKVLSFHVPARSYHSFFTPEKIREFEKDYLFKQDQQENVEGR